MSKPSKRLQALMDPAERKAAMRKRRKSGIKIKPQNKGKFTKYAKGKGESVQQAASEVLASPNASPKLKKRANFARNAANWNKG